VNILYLPGLSLDKIAKKEYTYKSNYKIVNKNSFGCGNSFNYLKKVFGDMAGLVKLKAEIT
jgi:hypothetical protein